jgi:hypothetical protein
MQTLVRRIRLGLAALGLYALAPAGAMAAPVTYYFDGQITGLLDGAGLAAAAGYVAVGQAISYAFTVDTARPGSSTVVGVTSIPACGGDSCYYTEHVSGGIEGAGPAPYNFTGLNTFNVESNSSTASGSQGGINISRMNDYGDDFDDFAISVMNSGLPDTSTITHWTPGVTQFLGFNQARRYTPTPQQGMPFEVTVSEIWTQLTLTSIGQTVPVPEPGTLLLVTAALAGLSLRTGRRPAA